MSEQHSDERIRPVSLTVCAAIMGVATCCVLYWLEGEYWTLFPIIYFVGCVFAGRELPENLTVTGLTFGAMAFVLIFGLTDLVLYSTNQTLLLDRLSNLALLADKQSNIEETLAPKTCPRWYLREEDGDDVHGWRHYWHIENADQTVLILGDSVVFDGLARETIEGYRKANIPMRIIDTSVQGYSAEDLECVLHEALQEFTPSLVIVGVCMNDLTLATTIGLDIGGGSHVYIWGERYTPEAAERGEIPLFVESSNTWYAQNKEAFEEFGSKAVIGYDGGLAFYREALTLGEFNANLQALESIQTELTRASIAAVFLLFPVNYHVEPNPTDPLYNHVLNFLQERGALVADLRPLYNQFTANELQADEDIYDVIHYRKEALLMAGHEALRLVGKDWNTADTTMSMSQLRLRLRDVLAEPAMAEALEKSIAP